MDPFSILLDGARARGTFVLRTILNPAWSVQVRDRVRLDAGDIAMMRGPDAFTFADDPRTPIQVVVQPGPRRTTAAGAELPEAADMGVRTWVNGKRAHENGADGASVLLIGKYSGPGEIATRLLRVLPPLLVIPAAGPLRIYCTLGPGTPGNSREPQGTPGNPREVEGITPQPPAQLPRSARVQLRPRMPLG
ncbi:cupin domain-containing protein [Streptomyces sp. NPDC002838]|uniref:cupin domain-containing protein n=1 Tax=Streptomyces sp. NPDC002838 TaxID=3154436 RepID=UPI0033287F94